MARLLLLTPYLSWPPEHGGRIRTRALFGPLAAQHELTNLSGVQPGEDEAGARAALCAEGWNLITQPLHPRFGRLPLRERLLKAARLGSGRSSLTPRFATPKLKAAVRAAARVADLAILDHVWLFDLVAHLGRCPFILSTHNVESALLAARADTETGLKAALTRREAHALARIERRLVQRAAATIAVSEEDRVRLVELAGSAHAPVVIPNGVDLRRRPFDPRPPGGALRLFYVGGYDYAPNADAALRLATLVMPLVQAHAPRAKAELVGQDPGQALSSLVGRKDVICSGRLEDVLPAWRAAHALVLPMRFGGGSRLKILEAFAVGCPVVTSAMGAEGLAPAAREHLWLAETPEEFAQAILSLGSDPERRVAKLRGARAFVERHHDWTLLAGRLGTLVEQALLRPALR